MISIDFDNITDEIVYRIFEVDGNEAEALNDSYLELFELICCYSFEAVQHGLPLETEPTLVANALF